MPVVSYKVRETCSLCAGHGLDVVLKLPNTPLANEYAREEDLGKEQEVFPLSLVLCRDCGHLQVRELVDPERLFKDYVYVTGTSPKTVEHCAAFARSIRMRGPGGHGNGLGLHDDSLIVEIGSNDGTQLKEFRKLGHTKLIGIEPATKIANASSVPTVNDFFTPTLAEQIVARSGTANLVIANNVFAHIADLRDVTIGVKTLLSPIGQFVFEVAYLVDVIEQLAFDTCLPPESQILTKAGWCPISSIKVGDRVLTHRGRFRAVTKVMCRSYAGPMSVIDVYGQSDKMRLTPEHPVYVRRGLGEFVDAGKVVKGDRVLKPAIVERSKHPWLRITTPAPGRGKRSISTAFRVDLDLMRVFGYYAAEGAYSTTKKYSGKDCAQADFSFGKSPKEKRLAEDCARRIRRIGGAVRVRLTDYGWHTYTSGPFARLLHRELGTGAANKRFPAWSYTAGDGLTKELLYGYVLGDGYAYRGGKYWRVTSVSENLAQDASLLANKLGYATSINRTLASKWKPKRIAGNKRITHAVQDCYDILIHIQPRRAIKMSFQEGYQHGTVRKVGNESYAGEVFNLAVAEDNSYVTKQGAVHNCYHEHFSHHAVAPLCKMFEALGMKVFDVERSPSQVGRGSLRVYVTAARNEHVRSSVLEAVVHEHEMGLFEKPAYEAFAARIEKAKKAVNKWRTKEGSPVIGYGAAAKLTTLMHAFEWGRAHVDEIVDDSPWKQGLYTPGTHIPIRSAKALDERRTDDACVIFAWNFADRILEKYKGSGKRFLIPLPELREVVA